MINRYDGIRLLISMVGLILIVLAVDGAKHSVDQAALDARLDKLASEMMGK